MPHESDAMCLAPGGQRGIIYVSFPLQNQAVIQLRTLVFFPGKQGGQIPASSFVAMGMTDADGSEFYKNTGFSADFDGYFNTAADALEANYASAVETLKKYAKLLYGQARLIGGMSLENPGEFSNLICELM